ncbi:MAG: NADH-quinone oxidoreductase subunit L, partial [Candidatus Eisenbacteria bacterium]|nr:NADH-quinone oxidoreductase subunit L [Candidatus Latescibacterota bacterium]MBD3303004.1 NADH-quinone oxidoreductase subunit L [Candidatus Eisenbacteria bacterium]
VGATPAVAAAFLLLGGAVGKSAQLPLQTWLPDAMAGPTPVSALIHAATMVTAGVYLIARMHPLFELAPAAMTAVAAIGAATLLIAGFRALAQRDIKRVLAYSTISQIGYMFLALGVGAWSAGIFHLMTHACFKALLFLGAGVVSLSLHHERDIFRMGGLRHRIPVTFWTFLIAGGALAGFPLITSGFFSKEWILTEAWIAPHGSPWLWAAGILGALVTAVYTFRLIFLVFYGPERGEPHRVADARMLGPLVVLGALSVAAGWLEIPSTLGGFKPFGHFLEGTFGAPAPHHAGLGLEWTLLAVAVAASLFGILLAWLWYLRPERRRGEERDTPLVPAAVARFWRAGWGFDVLYDVLFVRPLVVTARALRGDAIDLIYRGIVSVIALANLLLRTTQTGRLRWYAVAIAGGAVLVLFLVVFR